MAAQDMDFDRGEGKIRALSSTIRVLGRFNLVLTPLGLLVIWLLVLQWSWPFEVISLAMATLAVFLFGAFSGGIMLAAGSMLRRRSDDLGSCSCEDHGGSVGHATDMSAGSAHDMIRQIRAAVHEIRDISLHDPEDREAIRNRIHGNLQRAAAEQIVCAINDRRLGHARRLLTDAEAVYGESATLANLHERIKKATVRHEPLDYAHGKRLIEEYVVEGAWDEAEDLAHGLCDDHPDSDRCRQLWEDTRRARLYGHIRNCAEDHYWSEALAAAKEFLERFPDSLESKALTVQIETLAANAEIQHRKQYESKFKTHVEAEQWVEALRIARHLVERFPNSPQAEALRSQIPRLERKLVG